MELIGILSNYKETKSNCEHMTANHRQLSNEKPQLQPDSVIHHVKVLQQLISYLEMEWIH